MKNIAIIGYGGQGSWHAAKIMQGGVARLAGTYDIAEKQMALAREQGVFTYPSLDALLGDKTVDAVVIATPNNEHKALVLRALAAGKHVICEKPVDTTVAAFDEMVAAAKQSGRLFTVHQNRRWDNDYLAIRRLMESGEIGAPLHLESRVHGSRGIPGDWRQKKECGGGMIFDWGVHLLDQILQIHKEPVVRVYCETTHYTNNEVDDGFTVRLTFQSGQTATVEIGTHNFLSLPRFFLVCSEGTALIPRFRTPMHVAKMTVWQEKEVVPVQTAAGISKTMAPRDDESVKEYDVELPVSDAHDFYRNFCAAIDGKAELIVKCEEVRRVLQLIEAVFLSDERHQVIETNI